MVPPFLPFGFWGEETWSNWASAVDQSLKKAFLFWENRFSRITKLTSWSTYILCSETSVFCVLETGRHIMVINVGCILLFRYWCTAERQLSCTWSLLLLLWVVWQVEELADHVIMCPLLSLCFKVGLWAWSNILQWNVSVFSTFCVPEGSGAGWGPAGRMGKLIPGIHTISSQDEWLPLTGWKRFDVINLLSRSWLISEGMVLCQASVLASASHRLDIQPQPWLNPALARGKSCCWAPSL